MTDRNASLHASIRILFPGLVVAFFAGAAARADDWTTGVGGNPARTGLSAETGPQAPELLWQGSVDAVVAQQAVIEGDIAVMPRMFDLFDAIDGTDIVAHDLRTGEIRWTKQVPASFSDSWRNRVTAIRDGQVYATRAGNINAEHLYALDAADGEILWRSEDLITETSTESATFAPDGDPITTGVGALVRINREDGTTVWSAPRTCPTSGGCDAAVFGDRVYFWEAGVSGPVVTAVDLDTGGRLYSSEGIGGGFIQQNCLFVGPDGTIYAPRTQNNPITDFFVAFEDTGSALVEKWRIDMGFVAFASYGVGPDGSVYTYDRNLSVVRLDPETGDVLDVSEQITSDFYQPRMAIGADGTVYVTNGGFSQGRLYAFTPDLQLLWSESVPNVNVGGPAIGEDGIMIVCGTGTDVRAYDTQGGGGVSLTVDGTCPGGGPIAVSWSGAAPGGQVAVLYADATGSFAIPGGRPCAGTALGLANENLRVAFQGGAGADGSRSINGNAPHAACGGFLQLVDLDTCELSNVAVVE